MKPHIRSLLPREILTRTLVLILALVGGGQVEGQIITFAAGSASGVAPGSSVVIPFTVDTDTVLIGLSWGVAHDVGVVSIDSIAQNADLMTAQGGSSPDFYAANLVTGGFTLGVIIDFFEIETLPVGTGFGIVDVTYDVSLSPTSLDVSLDFVDTLGSPAVLTVANLVGGGQVSPMTMSGSINVLGPGFTFDCQNASGGYLPATGAGSLLVDLTIDEEFMGSPTDTLGFTMAFAHDDALLTPISMEPLGVIAAIDGGAGPDFFGVDLSASGPGGVGVTVGVIYDFLSMVLIAFPDETSVARVCYDTVPAALVGNMTGTTTTLIWTDEIAAGGIPPFAINNVTDDLSGLQLPTFVDCEVDLVPSLFFVRGDANDDGDVNTADAVSILNYLFLGAAAPVCLDAMDINDSSAITISDAFHVLCWLFCDPTGLPPVGPYPDCGVDTTADPFSCEQSGSSCGGCL